MREQEFRQAMKKRGKKEHVIDGLVDQVRAFETYLAHAGLSGLSTAGEQELSDDVKTLDPRAVKTRMRGAGRFSQRTGRRR